MNLLIINIIALDVHYFKCDCASTMRQSCVTMPGKSLQPLHTILELLRTSTLMHWCAREDDFGDNGVGSDGEDGRDCDDNDDEGGDGDG